MKPEKPRPDAKSAIVHSAFRLFRKQGFNRVSMDDIASAANVTKRTVYYHFASKDDILTKVLETQRASDMAEFQSWPGDRAQPPADFVQQVFDQMIEWACSENWLGPGITRVAMELAHLPGHPARALASRYKLEIETWIAQQIGRRNAPNAPQLAQQIMTLIEGSMCLTLIHGDTRYMTQAAKTAHQLVARTDTAA